MTQQDLISGYNKTAALYADHYFGELSKKPQDREILTAFAGNHKDNGRVLDLGCGPGQTTRFLHDHGVHHILGTDIAPGMIEKARALNPNIEFETADMLCLGYADESFAAALAFYAIVHFSKAELEKSFAEVFRVLKKGGEFLFSFHIGTETIHRNELFDIPVNLDFHFFETKSILAMAQQAGFHSVQVIEREPYPEVEFPSRRAYITVKKNG
jgi:ubiquinone/menaquinone biosynthesis C-methylase UbiE